MYDNPAISSASILALKASLTASIDDRLRICRQTTAAAEDQRIKSTHRLCQTLREVIGSVLASGDADADQLDQASKLKSRIRAVDPRRERDAKKRSKTKDDQAEAVSSGGSGDDSPGPARAYPKEMPFSEYEDWLAAEVAKDSRRVVFADIHLLDEVDRTVDPAAAIDRVKAKYGTSRPTYGDNTNLELLQTALGATPDDRNVVQLWLALACWFKESFGCIRDAMPEQTTWIMTAICQFVNLRHIGVPAPNCLSVMEYLKFRE